MITCCVRVRNKKGGESVGAQFPQCTCARTAKRKITLMHQRRQRFCKTIQFNFTLQLSISMLDTFIIPLTALMDDFNSAFMQFGCHL